jgi:hypothetical protein
MSTQSRQVGTPGKPDVQPQFAGLSSDVAVPGFLSGDLVCELEEVGYCCSETVLLCAEPDSFMVSRQALETCFRIVQDFGMVGDENSPTA